VTRLIVLLAAAAAPSCGGGGAGPSSDGATARSTPVSKAIPCSNATPIVAPSWLPADLPLPSGAQATSDRSEGSRHEAIFAIPGTAEDVGRFLVTEWPKRGWALGRGDAEPGEVEDSFRKGSVAGEFKVNTETCPQPRSRLVLGIEQVSPSAT